MPQARQARQARPPCQRWRRTCSSGPVPPQSASGVGSPHATSAAAGQRRGYVEPRLHRRDAFALSPTDARDVPRGPLGVAAHSPCMRREGVGLGLALRLVEVLHVRRVAASSVVWRHRLPLTRWSHSIPSAARSACRWQPRRGAYSAAHRSVLRVISTAAEEGETVEIITCASERPEGRSPQGYSRVLTGAPSLPNARPSGRQQGGASGTMKGRAAAARVVCVRGAWSWREKRGRPASGALRWRRRTVREFPQNDSLRT